MLELRRMFFMRGLIDWVGKKLLGNSIRSNGINELMIAQFREATFIFSSSVFVAHRIRACPHQATIGWIEVLVLRRVPLLPVQLLHE